MQTKAAVLGATLIVVLAFAACSSSSSSSQQQQPSPSTVPGGTATGSGGCKTVGDKSQAKHTITVTEKEWSITTSTNRTTSGLIHFAVTNDGHQKHELAVFQGAPASLITLANGAIDEQSLAEDTLVGRVEVPAGQHCDLTVRLARGIVTLACNLVDQGPNGTEQVHFAMGMSQALVVS